MNWDYAATLGDVTDPWNGAVTLPHVLSLKTYPEGIRLVQTPAAELQSLRGQKDHFENERIAADSRLLDPIRGGLLELVAEFELGTSLIFPDPTSDALEIYANNGHVQLVSLDVFELKSVWKSGEPLGMKTIMEEE
ncbi:hypothetical protein [Paenibacillus baekrokdamisoli]|nr:hypothetical protein [Paenibacillus baekrokdamisoli]